MPKHNGVQHDEDVFRRPYALQRAMTVFTAMNDFSKRDATAPGEAVRRQADVIANLCNESKSRPPKCLHTEGTHEDTQ